VRKFFKDRAIKKLIASQSTQKFDGLAKAKSALILFRNETPVKSSLALAIEGKFTRYNMQIDFLGYLPLKLEKGAEAPDGFYFKNQLNWLGLPKTETVQDLTNKDYDVIIDLDEELDSPNNFILLSAKAGIRVGVNKLKKLYDLTVEKADNNEESIVNEIEFYLKNIVKA
jgi:hypothetical protein